MSLNPWLVVVVVRPSTAEATTETKGNSYGIRISNLYRELEYR